MAADKPLVMVALISRQTMQNLLPILQYQPQRVVFLSTREEDDRRQSLEAVLQERQIAVDPPLYVDAYAPESTLQACRQLLEQYGPAGLMANLTGGTKVMSLAAFRVFAAAGVPCIYTDTPHRRLLFLAPDGQEPALLHTGVDVLTYLRAHGQHASLRGRTSRASYARVSAFMGQHIVDLDPFLSRVRYELHEAPERMRLRFKPEGKQRHAVAGEFLVLAMDHGLLEFRQSGPREVEMLLANPQVGRYLAGEWLEDLVFETVKQHGFDSCASNVALAWKDAPDREMNEIDVAVVHHLRFYYISCKTGNDAQQMKQHLYELETLSTLAGGVFNHPILVASSTKAVPTFLRRRMETLGIAYIGPADLPRLGVRLQDIIR